MKQLRKLMVALIAVLGINVSLAAETAASTCAHEFPDARYEQICKKCNYPFDGLTKCNHANDIKAGITVTPVGEAPAGWELWDPDGHTGSQTDANAYFGERDGRLVYIVYKFVSAKASYITKQVDIAYNGETKRYEVIIDASVQPYSFISTPKALKFENGTEIVYMADGLLRSSGSGRYLYELATADAAKLPIVSSYNTYWFYIDADCSAQKYTDRMDLPAHKKDTVTIVNRNATTRTLTVTGADGSEVINVLRYATVRMNPNDGTFKNSTDVYTVTTSMSSNTTVTDVPTKDGSIFAGWKRAFTYDLLSSSSVTYTLTLTAQWKEYVVNGNSYGSIEEAVTAAKANNSSVEIKTEASSTAIPAAATEVPVKIEIAAGTVEFDKDASTTVAGATLNIEEVEGAAAVYEITLTKDDETVSELNGTATVSIPVPEALTDKKVVVYFVAEDGTKTLVEGATVENDKVVFTTTHFSAYAIEDAATVWDGTSVATDWTGDGTAGNPFMITTAAQLAGLAQSVNGDNGNAGKIFMLAADINLNNHPWTGIGVYGESDTSKAFQGTFDGNGKMIFNVTFAASKYCGLFNQLYTATVKNLTVNGNGFGESASENYGGAMIAGFANNATIENCVARGTLLGTHNVAGIVVRIKDATIKNCTNKAALTSGYTKIGGIVNLSQNSATGCLIEGCVNEGTVTSTAGGADGVGGIIGWIGSRSDNGASADEGQRVTIRDCENKGVITGTETAVIGQIVGKPLSYWSIEGANKGLTTTLAVGSGSTVGLNYATVADGVASYTENLTAGNTYLVTAPNAKPMIKLAPRESITFDTSLATIDASGITADVEIKVTTDGSKTTYKAEATNWIQVANTTWYNKNDTEFTLTSAEQLAGLAKLVNEGNSFAGETVTLGKDIDLSGLVWSGIGVFRTADKPFKGVFDGCGKKIGNVVFADNGTAEDSNTYRALFNHINGATVKNVTVEGKGFDARIAGEYGGAMIAGFASDSTVEDCVAEGSISGTHSVAGIVVRVKDSIVKGCTNKATITGSHTKSGGIVALLQDGTGVEKNVIEACVNYGSVTATGSNGGKDGIGGVVARSQSEFIIKDCENYGIVSAELGTALLGQIYGGGYNNATVQGINKGRKDVLSISSGNNTQGLTYATVEGDIATYVKSADLKAGMTYLVTATDAKPKIALKGGESITFDQSLATIEDGAGITPASADGVILEPNTEGAKVTYTAAIAKVGEVAYGDFNVALDAAKDAEDKTVTVLGDVNWGDGFAVPEGVAIKTGADVTVKAPTGYVWENMSLVKVTNWLQIADATWYNDSGTEFTISTAQELAGLITLVNGGNTLKDKTITLAADIDLSGATLGTTGVLWDGIGVFQKFTADGKKPFEGTFNGNNKTISKMTFSNGKYRGLFNLIMNGAVVKDLTVAGNGFGNSEVPQSGEFGGAFIAGGSYGATIQNCVAEGTFITTHNTAGIAVTVQDTTIDGCMSRVDITCTADKFAGIVCLSENNSNETSTQIKNSVNDGSLHVAHVGAANDNDHGGIHGVGGIVGYLNHGASKGWIVIENCTNKGTITKIAGNEVARIGQIAGYPNAVISPTGNKGLTTTLAAGANALNGLTYATVAEENGIDVATYVKSGDLTAGGTYLVTAKGAKPVIALKGGESITFDQSLATIEDGAGITPASADGVILEPNTEGAKVTYTAAIAKVGEVAYGDFNVALDAAKDAEDKTVTVLGDVNWGDGFTVPGGVTIKTGADVTVKAPVGYEWSNGSLAVFTPGGAINPAIVNCNKAEIAGGTWQTIYSEATIRAQKSMVVKLYSGETLLGATELVDTEKVLLNGASNSVTWHFFLYGSDDWWKTTLEAKQLLANVVPDKVELWCDGVKVGENTVSMRNSNDNLGAATETYNWGDLKNVMVAKIDVAGENGETETNYYDTLQEAIDAATAGETVTLIGDTRVLGAEVEANSGEFFVQVLGKNLTLDLNGKTVNGSFYLNSGSTVKFQNGTILNLAGNASSGIESVGGNIELTNMTISNTVRHAIRVKGSTAVINGGNYAATGNGTFHVVNVSHASTVTINGGTFTGNKGNSSAGGNTVMIQDNASNVAINGGTFSNAAGSEGCISAAAGLVLSGGKYDTWSYDNYLATDKKYLAIKNADDLYEVVEFTNWAQVANTDWYNAEEPQTAYTLSSAEQLAGLAKLVNAGTTFAGVTITLGADIDLSGASYGEGVSGIEWTPIGAGTTPFAGHFNGDFKTISNLKVATGADKQGLFGAVKNNAESRVAIKNVTLNNVHVGSGGNKTYVGALIGEAFCVDLEACHVTGTILVTGSRYVGGLVGGGYIKAINCSVVASEKVSVPGNVVASYQLGGIIGIANTSKLTDCTVSNLYIWSKNGGWVGGIVGHLGEGAGYISGCTVADSTIDSKDQTVEGYVVGNIVANQGYSYYIINNSVTGVAFTGGTTASNNISKDTLDTGMNTVSGTGVVLDAAGKKVVSAERCEMCSDSLVAEGSIKVDNGDGTCKVFAIVAKIGDTPYATIQAAIDAATETANTIVVVGDVTESGITVATDDKVVIDLNGNTVYGDFMVYGNATIKNGTIDSTSTGRSGIEINNEKNRDFEPKLVTENLTIVSGRHALRVDGGTVNIKSGFYTAADAASNHAVNISDGGKVTIDGGTFVGNSQSGTGAVAMRDETSELTINDGTFTGGSEGSLTVWDGTTTVNGGAFETIAADSPVTIVGGVFDAVNKLPAGSNISGGTFKTDPSQYLSEGYVGVKQDDGTYKIEKVTNWIQIADTTWFTGDADTYTLTTAKQLAGLAKLVNEGNNFANKTVTLDADIDLDAYAWTPIGISSTYYFAGTFDGGEKIVSNVTVSAENYAGLFGRVINGTLMNITVNNATVTGTGWYIGAVVGGIKESDVVNCDVIGTTTVSAAYVAGGVVGLVQGTADKKDSRIVDCDVSGAIKVSATWYVGGIAGGYQTCFDIENCTVTGSATTPVTLNGTYFVGGILGHNNEGVVISDCDVSYVNVTASTGAAGGIAGMANRDNVIKGCSASHVTVEATVAKGAIVGGNYGADAQPVKLYNNTSDDTSLDIISNCDRDGKVNTASHPVIIGSRVRLDENNKVTRGIFTAFNEAIADKILAPRAFWTKNDDATHTVRMAVAEMNGAKYSTLQAAIDAALDANGGTVKLLADVTGEVRIEKSVVAGANLLSTFAALTAAPQVTLDLNGHTVAQVTVPAGANLKIVDSATAQTPGRIEKLVLELGAVVEKDAGVQDENAPAPDGYTWSNNVLTANKQTVKVTVSPVGFGTVTGIPTGDVDYGTTFTLTAVPEEGYVFAGWTGDFTELAAEIEVKVAGDVKLTANFVPAALYTSMTNQVIVTYKKDNELISIHDIQNMSVQNPTIEVKDGTATVGIQLMDATTLKGEGGKPDWDVVPMKDIEAFLDGDTIKVELPAEGSTRFFRFIPVNGLKGDGE